MFETGISSPDGHEMVGGAPLDTPNIGPLVDDVLTRSRSSASWATVWMSSSCSAALAVQRRGGIRQAQPAPPARSSPRSRRFTRAVRRRECPPGDLDLDGLRRSGHYERDLIERPRFPVRRRAVHLTTAHAPPAARRNMAVAI